MPVIRLPNTTYRALEIVAGAAHTSVPLAVDQLARELFQRAGMVYPESPDAAPKTETSVYRVEFYGKPSRFAGGAPYMYQSLSVEAANPKQAIERARKGLRVRPGVSPELGGVRFRVTSGSTVYHE
jgi:hypothetical protein